ncbi:MAG: isopeptide-forming domain-containing fimbrial protein [Lachnospiraceae bacterium]|nr:isopeptide-forming domain-containing fimbrial protein [Lachnospiraceae bacterium]
MKKFKKIFAVLLTLAMVLGMSMTSFAAATDKGSITISGLAAGETTTLNMYQFISLSESGNEWVVADWAKDCVTIADGKYSINESALKEAVSGTPKTVEVTGTEYTYSDVAIGAYLILASGDKATYTPMIADVADYGTDGLITAKNVTITAKTSGYVTTKTADDDFIARGQKVTFTITTTFPSFANPVSQDNSFKIIDKPTGLDITGVKSILVGGETLTSNDYVAGYNTEDTREYVINLTSQIGNANANAGKTVVVEYEATVTADDGYQNSANAYRNDTKLGENDVTVKGFTGSITVRKIEQGNPNNVLKGAEFTVTKKGETEDKDETLYFVLTAEGEYKLASASEAGASQTVVATNGTVKVKGLGDGTYHFTETKAPEGYSIAQNVLDDVEITADKENVDRVDGLDYPNTKLSSLPSTGGIGTTIFTIGGCAIMIIAAALFFASRRKAAK